MKHEESEIDSKTRFHSSRMRTAHALTVSPSMLCAVVGVSGAWSGGGVYAWSGGMGGACSGGSVHGLGGWVVGAWSGGWWYPSIH